MAEEGGHLQVAIDITADKLVALRNNRHQTATTEPLPCIVRVLKTLKKLNPEAYDPEVVGLGPYHHHHFNPNFDVRSHKFKALDRALGRSLYRQGWEATDENVKDLLQQLRVYVTSFENEIKACYSEDFKFDADVFVLDAVFLLEFCFSNSKSMKSDRFHPLLDCRMFSTRVGISVQRDLIKLENQIPLLLLRELTTWKGMFLLPGDNPCDFDFAPIFQLFQFQEGLENLRQVMADERRRPKHLIDCVYRCIFKSMRQHSNENGSAESGLGITSPLLGQEQAEEEQANEEQAQEEQADEEQADEEQADKYDNWIIPAANELDKVGIVVHPATLNDDNSKLCFKPGRFRLRGHLYLPKMTLDDDSEAILRNLMAYEEFCVEGEERFFNRYMVLVSQLIRTETDATILVKQGVINNFLENNESVAHLFNRLQMFITPDGMYEINKEIVEKVRAYYRSSLRVMLRDFIQTHFANPWYACATIAAVVLLVCTVVQAVYAVK